MVEKNLYNKLVDMIYALIEFDRNITDTDNKDGSLVQHDYLSSSYDTCVGARARSKGAEPDVAIGVCGVGVGFGVPRHCAFMLVLEGLLLAVHDMIFSLQLHHVGSSLV
ncbi:hypothetical protein Q3G72_007441 [Acer saccharum]|nr:hypothetical protein Q3G72_007441 [Acer saccharum]